MELYNIIVIAAYIICIIVSLYVSIILHEWGHFIFGRLSGYQFVSFRIMKWLWTKDETGKIKLTKGVGLDGISGQCLMAPPEDEKDFRFVLYNAGGSLVNLIIGLVLLVTLFFTDNDIVELILLGSGYTSLFLGAMNIIPLKIGAIPNDGKNINEALKSNDAKHGFYMMLKVNSELSKGKLLSDYDDNAFIISENADINNFLVANIIMIRSSQLEEQGAYEHSYHELLRLNTSKLPSYYGSLLILSMMFHELVYFGDEVSVLRARERIEMKIKDKLFQKILQMQHPAFLPFQAAKIAFLDGDANKARELIAQARKLNSSLQNPGSEHSVTFMLDKLESRLN